MGLIKALFGNYSEKEIKRIKPIQAKVLGLDEEYQKLTDDELRHKTDEFKERLNAGETLDDIMPEAFASCREAASRVLGMKHFPVQIIPMPAMTAEVLNWHGASMESRMRW